MDQGHKLLQIIYLVYINVNDLSNCTKFYLTHIECQRILKENLIYFLLIISHKYLTIAVFD